MLSIEEFLSLTRVVEILAMDSCSIYRTFQVLLDSILPGARLVPIRSVSADVYCVRRSGVAYVIWDESYIASVMSVAETLLGRKTQAAIATEALALSIMADLLFDEGRYEDAWIAGSIAAQYLPLQDEQAPKSSDSPIETVTYNMGLSFVFLHEVGHLVQRNDPLEFAKFRRKVEAEISAYSDWLDRMPAADSDAVLAGEGFMFPQQISELTVRSNSRFIGDNSLIDESAADLLATEVVFSGNGWMDSTAKAIDVAEFILAVRMAMEFIRDIRLGTRRLAIEDRTPEPVTPAELMRGVLLRHGLLHTAASFAQTPKETMEVGDEFGARYHRLFDRRKASFGDLPERLVDFGLGRIKKFRLRMQSVPRLFGSNLDVTTKFRDSYLRIRGWKPRAEPDSLDGLLDALPILTGGF
jgi:hypothetical protein